MGIERVEIGNAIIAGIASGDGALEQMSEIVSHLERAGFVIVPRIPTTKIGMAIYAAWDKLGEEAVMGPEEAVAIYRAAIDAAMSD